MEFRLLGHLEVVADGQVLDLVGTRQQTVLACLLLHPGQLVSVERLSMVVYGKTPPSTARNQIQIAISSLRRLLAENRDDIIQTQSGGYLLKVNGHQLDSHMFEASVQEARDARDAGDADAAITLYKGALALWRGPALNGIYSQELESAATRLNELRINTKEDCIDLELARGRHHEVINELTALVEEHPLRERLHAQLMLALYRAGRQAEALHAYRTVRQLMIDELGIEPNERLQHLERAILTCDPQLTLAKESRPFPGTPVDAPRLLPTDIGDFVGREQEVQSIERILVDSAMTSALRAVPIVVVTGMPGVGKSVTAVHVSHRLADRYPDGQLFADLGGGESHRLSPMQVLESFLRALGVSSVEIPEDLEERASLYRRLIGNRRILIVLDDAVSERQVLPLVPGIPGSAVLITSRKKLAALPGAHHVEIGVFGVRQSLNLLAQIAGPQRIVSDVLAAEAMAELCGNLPLALRIVGARISARPYWSIEQHLCRLQSESRRLDELSHADLDIRSTISMIYESVSEEARCLLRRLAIFDTPRLSEWLAVVLLNATPRKAEDLLDELTEAHLIEPVMVGAGQYSQYRFHDLIRAFAREKLTAEETIADQKSLLERILSALLRLTETAHTRVYGGPYVKMQSSAHRWSLPEELVGRLMAAPFEWLERERVTLVSGVHEAARAGFADLCWDLALCSVTLFEARMHLDDWRDTHQVALDATRRARNARGEAATIYSIGSLHIHEQRFEDARRELETAAGMFRSMNEERGWALAIRNIALLDRIAGRFADAEAHYAKALKVFRCLQDWAAVAYVLHGMAQLKLEIDESDEAERLLAEALVLARGAGSRRVEAQVLHRMGEVRLSSGDPLRAAQDYDQALRTVCDVGDVVGEAYTLHGLGMAHLRLDRPVEAADILNRGLRLATRFGLLLLEAQIRLGMGELELRDGHHASAVSHYQQALELSRRIGAFTLSERVSGMLDEIAARS